jgi:hypothetical protein
MLTVAPATSEVAEGRLHVANATLKSWSCIRNTVSIPMQPLGCMCNARVATATHRVPPRPAELGYGGRENEKAQYIFHTFIALSSIVHSLVQISAKTFPITFAVEALVVPWTIQERSDSGKIKQMH